MNDILTVATAGLKPNQLTDTDHIQYPRVDYVELQRLLKMDVIDYSIYNTALGKHIQSLETKLRSDLYLSLNSYIRRRSYRLIFTMSERAGIPFSGFRRFLFDSTPYVSLMQNWSSRQERVIQRFGLFSKMDSIIIICESMKQHFLKLGVPANRIHLVPFSSVDHCFFSPIKGITPKAGFILSLGEIRTRDYASLFQAVDGLPLELLVAASGSWYAREKHRELSIAVPENVTISGGFSHSELKRIYAQSQFVIIPVYDSIFSAGVTGVLEAAAMGRAVIANRSRGLTDFIIDGETGIFINPGDIDAMREAIQYLIAHPEEAKRMGENGRQLVDEKLNIDVYVERIAQILTSHL